MKRGAQTLTEYATVIGIVTAVLLAMTPMIRRSVQSMIKATADQVGIQKNAEQKFNDSGYLEHSYAVTRSLSDTETVHSNVTVNHYIHRGWVRTSVNMLINLGFTPEP